MPLLPPLPGPAGGPAPPVVPPARPASSAPGGSFLAGVAGPPVRRSQPLPGRRAKKASTARAAAWAGRSVQRGGCMGGSAVPARRRPVAPGGAVNGTNATTMGAASCACCQQAAGSTMLCPQGAWSTQWNTAGVSPSPPTTPPTMAPMGAEDDEDVGGGADAAVTVPLSGGEGGGSKGGGEAEVGCCGGGWAGGLASGGGAAPGDSGGDDSSGGGDEGGEERVGGGRVGEGTAGEGAPGGGTTGDGDAAGSGDCAVGGGVTGEAGGVPAGTGVGGAVWQGISVAPSAVAQVLLTPPHTCRAGRGMGCHSAPRHVPDSLAQHARQGQHARCLRMRCAAWPWQRKAAPPVAAAAAGSNRLTADCRLTGTAPHSCGFCATELSQGPARGRKE